MTTQTVNKTAWDVCPLTVSWGGNGDLELTEPTNWLRVSGEGLQFQVFHNPEQHFTLCFTNTRLEPDAQWRWELTGDIWDWPLSQSGFISGNPNYAAGEHPSYNENVNAGLKALLQLCSWPVEAED